jgi:hypothetical protein
VWGRWTGHIFISVEAAKRIVDQVRDLQHAP